ncbi:MAG: aminotransferase class I/II-fold pyridoxal phosphate-dependent enzyme [Alphaproteobacteria bacterium]|nr:aminotransferase class I/II-fold pyridoxal phosphate-dependent enzyme [Alphaproteobacteria bacterium SS10]
MPINPRIDALPDYPFQRLRNLLDPITPTHNGEPLNLTIGEPQGVPPEWMTEVVTEHAHLWGKYPPIDGTAAYRQAARDWMVRRYGQSAATLDPDKNILPVAGTKEALYFLASFLSNPEGAEKPLALLPNPAYMVYEGAGVMAGCQLHYLPATAETDYLPDLDKIEPEAMDRAAFMYLCAPSNPEGAAASEAYWRKAIALARRHDFVLVADECYADVYLGDTPPDGAIQAADGDFTNLLLCHSLSKRSNAAGLRAGFVAGDPDLIAPFKRLRSYGAAVMPLPLVAAATALWNDDDHAATIRKGYQDRFAIAHDALKDVTDWQIPDGGFFIWLKTGDSLAMTEKLWREQALRVLPGAYLGKEEADGSNPGRDYIRVALVHDLATVEQACSRLRAAL